MRIRILMVEGVHVPAEPVHMADDLVEPGQVLESARPRVCIGHDVEDN
jgi:hypothetical protein